MNQNQKMLLGVGVLAVAGYMLWQQSRKKSFASRRAAAPIFAGKCGKGTGICCFSRSYDEDTKMFTCCKGHKEKGTANTTCPGGGSFADYGTPMDI